MSGRPAHRIVGAILLYLLIAVAFATQFAFVGLSNDGAIKGIAFDDDRSIASELFYMSFVTLTSTGYGDIVPVHPFARSLCNMPTLSGDAFGKARYLRIERAKPMNHIARLGALLSSRVVRSEKSMLYAVIFPPAAFVKKGAAPVGETEAAGGGGIAVPKGAGTQPFNSGIQVRNSCPEAQCPEVQCPDVSYGTAPYGLI
jgi:Ion channel